MYGVHAMTHVRCAQWAFKGGYGGAQLDGASVHNTTVRRKTDIRHNGDTIPSNFPIHDFDFLLEATKDPNGKCHVRMLDVI